MVEYSSNDEELEKFKQWWKESGQQWVMIALLAVSGYFGWQFWQDRQQQNAEQGYLLYQQLLDAVQGNESDQFSDKQAATITHLAVKLKEEHAGSQYAHYASLMLARQAVQSQDYELAAEELNQVMQDADEGLSAIARLRLSRVEAIRSGPDAALALLNVDVPEAFVSSYAEARGDYFQLKGDAEAARESYASALAQLGENQQQQRGILSSKLNQVTPAKPVDIRAEEKG